MRRVSLAVLGEFAAEVTQQQYAASANAAARRGVCAVLRWVALCPVALQCDGLCFALVQVSSDSRPAAISYVDLASL